MCPWCKRGITSHLFEKITSAFEIVKQINISKNKEAFQAAIIAYSKHMSDVKPGKNKCLHPDDLRHEHESAKCKALLAFRPRKTCPGFEPTDEDERTLLNILEQQYAETKDINDSANETAEASALNEYITMMDNACRFSLWWLFLVPFFINLSKRSQFHSHSKQKALELFDSQREGRRFYGTDVYRSNLDKCDDDPPHPYMQTFVLKPLGDSFFVQHDIFRLGIHDIATA